MTIDQLFYFLSVSNNCHFSHSAEELYISQASLSKQVQALEKELDIPLFVRSTRSVKLTEAGKVVQPYAARILSEYNAMKMALADLTYRRESSLVVSAFPLVEHYGITGAVSNFAMQSPDIEVRLQEDAPKNILEALELGQIDLGILRAESIKSGQYKLYPLIRDEIAFMCTSKHPLANREMIDMQDLEGERISMAQLDCRINQTCMNAFQKEGVDLEWRILDNRINTLLRFVNQGQYVTLQMCKTVNLKVYPDIRIIPIRQKILSVVSAVTKDETPSLLCKSMIDYLTEYFSQL